MTSKAVKGFVCHHAIHEAILLRTVMVAALQDCQSLVLLVPGIDKANMLISSTDGRDLSKCPRM